MAERVPWSREDIIIAYALYCIVPLNQIRTTNKLIQQVSEGFSHSTSSLVMRMQNFAAIDPNSKIKGATHVAKVDREIFEEFQHDWGALSVQAEQLTGLALFDANPVNGAKPLSTLTDKNRVSRERHFFRASVFASYENTCCISGMSIPAMLVASHIKPFSKCRTTSERTDPANGLLLNTFYDKAFDQGLITVLPDYTIHCSTLVNEQSDDFTHRWLIGLEGKPISLPERFYPSAECLEYHNKVIFKG
jgi:putative restriction endonuclease